MSPSAIKGVELECVYPEDPSQASAYKTRRTLRHVIFTAETHNFPTGQDTENILSSCAFLCAYNPFIPNDRRRCSIQRCHHRDRRAHQRCAERRAGSPRHCWHCRILLWQPAHTRSAGIIQDSLLLACKCINNLSVLTDSRLCSPLGVFRRRLGVSVQLCTATAGGDRGQRRSLRLRQQVWRACSVRSGRILSENEKMPFAVSSIHFSNLFLP